MAGIFGFFDYSKPGKGVSKDEAPKPHFLHFWELFFRKFWKLIQLNLLYVASCLLIVTIGPATAGLMYVLRNFATERPVFLVSDFWDGFKNNLKQSLAFSALSVFVAVALYVSTSFYVENIKTAGWMYVPFSFCVIMCMMFVFMSFYVMPMIVTLDLKLSAILKNAAIFAVVCLKTNFITLFFVLITLLAVYILQGIGFLLTILIIPAMIGFIICFNVYPQIKKYAVDPYIEKQKAESANEDISESGSVFSDGEETVN